MEQKKNFFFFLLVMEMWCKERCLVARHKSYRILGDFPSYSFPKRLNVIKILVHHQEFLKQKKNILKVFLISLTKFVSPSELSSMIDDCIRINVMIEDESEKILAY
jgi:hypothetical protein